jgi:hypothetical protein
MTTSEHDHHHDHHHGHDHQGHDHGMTMITARSTAIEASGIRGVSLTLIGL